MKGSGAIIMIRDLHEIQGKSISQIATELNLSRNTVRKFLRGEVSPDKRIGSKRGSKLDPFQPKIEALIQEGIYNSVVIFDRLVEIGYDGKLSILKDYLKPLRPATIKDGPAIRRFESKPGSQVQMDWGICHYQDPRGRMRKVACFIMVLGYSRMRYIEFTKRCDLRSLLRCIVHAFEYYGGIPDTLLTDRMKTVVLYSEGQKITWQTDFERFASELGFIPKLCRVRRPQTKGKVERLVHYVKDNFMPGRQFTDLVDLNAQAQVWLAHVNGQVHGTTHEIPLDLLADEKLKPLPADGRHTSYTWEIRKASLDGFVSFDGIKYGVHWCYSGQGLRVRLHGGKIVISDIQSQVIQEHDVWRSGRTYVFAKGQYDGLLAAQGQVKAPKVGRQIEPLQVEVRELSTYERVAGGY